MKIAFNPSTVAALTSPPNNKDITFDLRGRNIFARGVKFYGTDTNTWRDIKVNNVSIGSHTLDLRNGSNTTLTNTNGVVTINSTQRPVVDNLTSDSTTSSLSANQGRVLAGLINGKSDSDHNHDGRYLKLTGGTLTGNLIGTSAMFSGRFYGGGDDEGIIIKPSPNGYAGLILGTHDGERSIFYFVKNKPFWRYSHGSDNLDIIHPKKSGTIALTSDIPTSLKNPHALTISLNGTSQGPYDGSAAKNINITPGSIGAAVSDHSHDYLVVNTADDKSFNSAYHNFQVLYAGGSNGITGKPASVDAFGLFRFRAAAGWSGQMLLANGGSLYIRSSEDAKMTNTLAWKTILDSSNYSGILDSRYYTESEVDNLLDAKLNRQNLSYGTWNPRGYNLAADYHYNGGDLSISESKGQIHVSIDGYFWQNEGKYRVLDTSDVASLKGDLTVHQYLSATDATWWPLIWGGSSHANTSNSTGAVYKSHDVLSWQTSSQTLYTTHLRTTYIDLENNRGIFQVTSKGTSPFKGIKLPDLQSNGIGMFSKLGDGSGADEGGIIISADTSVIYNSFDTGWGLSVRDKDRGQTDISGDSTIAFGVRQDYRAYSLGGFEKSGSDNSYVLLGGGGHKAESALNVANADTVDGEHALAFTRIMGRHSIYTSGTAPYNYIHLFRIACSSGYSTIDCEIDFRTRYHSAKLEIRISTGQYPYNSGGTSISIIKKVVRGRSCKFWILPTIQTSKYNYYDVYYESGAWNSGSYGIIFKGSNGSIVFEPKGINLASLPEKVIEVTSQWISWDAIAGKPSSFAPSAHTHKWTDITDRITKVSQLTNDMGYLTSHQSLANYYTKTEVNNTFVRAGNFESANLNSLDTYSFIKSVNSNVASASPNGNTGWYNVIQAVHRNGAADGPGYIGQIALGMTTNINGMFYRTKYKGSWYAWNEVVTTNTGLLRYSRNNVNISSPNCSPIPPSLLEWTIGYPRLYDPEFNDGYNNVGVYNNAGNGVVTVTRVHDTNVGNSSSYVMKVVSAAGAIPNYGGWHVATQTELGKVYTCLFRASIPSGVEIEWNSNSIGTGGQMSWLTNNMGTGKWTWYAVQVYCGSGGSTTFFFSAKSPCTWYLSYVNVIENNRASYAGLRSVYSDYLKANASIVFGRNELQYFNQYTGVTAGATSNANPKTNWYHILRMNHANNSGYFVDLAIPFFDNKIQFRRITNGSDNGWRRVITEEPNHDVILREASTDGNVGIGINNPAYKLDVNGQMRAEGFHHWTVNSDNYMLLAGGGYKSFGGDDSNPIFLGYLNLDHGNDGTVSSSFSCLGYSVPFTYTRGGNYCRIYIPDTTHQVFYIKAATASVNYSGGGMDTWVGYHRGSGAWWLHCYASGTNEVKVKGFRQSNGHNDSWWGGNPLWSDNDGANKITVCIFGYVKFR